jgi:putative two-component system response regulator
MNAIGGSIIRHRILIVDDAQDNVDMLEAFLSEEASAIKGVTQSNQVERVFNEFEPDLMLLDLHMPAPDGLEILRNLRSVRESLGFLPVIVLTGDTGRTARNSALLLGADDFLLKPLDRQEVVLRVRNLLRTRRLWVELAEANRALERKTH